MYERDAVEAKVRVAFKRFETDEEFKKRLLMAGVDPWKLAGEGGKRLDDIGWSLKQMQRRIVDDVA